VNEEFLLKTALAVWSVILGAFLCALYDIFRVFRLRRRQNAVTLFVCDLVYCLASTVCMMLLFFNLSYGRMRAYSFALIAFGFLVWRFTVSRVVMSLLLRLFKLTEHILNSIKSRVLFAIALATRRIYTANYCKKTVLQAKRGSLRDVKTKGS
jgi:hypothetical protein